jgi:C4-dicarboxylate transporter DctM subunit
VLVDAHWRGRAHAIGVRLGGLLAALLVCIAPPALTTWLLKLLLPASAGGSALGVPIGIAWLIFAHLRIRPSTRLAALFPPAGREVWESFWDSLWGLMLIVVVIGGIYGGLFTPTEAAAVSAVYAGFVALVIYRDMPWRHLRQVLLDSANMSAMLLYIITNAILFSFLLTSENIPQQTAGWVIEQGLAPWMFLLFVNILLFFAGDFMEPSSIILILAPIFLPVAMQLGIDPIHLGIIMTINMELGMITPPVGLNLYVASGLARMGLTEVTLAAAPWILVVAAVLLLVTYVPEISLWLPNLVYGKGG